MEEIIDEVTTTKKNETKLTFKKHFTVAFWVTLVISILLAVTGFFMPPIGVIDGSVITTIGILLLWPALGLGARAIDEGRMAKFTTKHAVLTVGEDEKK